MLKDVFQAIRILLSDPKIRTVTVFCSPLFVSTKRVRATRTKDFPGELRINIGESNYREREYLGLCRKVKARPRRVWLHYFPK